MNIWQKIYNEWFALPEKVRYLLLTVVNFTISYLLYAVLVTFTGYKYYQGCVFLQWFIPSLVVYFIQKFYIFKTTGGNVLYEYLKYCATWFFCFICNVAILEFFINCVTRDVYVSQFFALLIVSALTYILMKKFAFINNKK